MTKVNSYLESLLLEKESLLKKRGTQLWSAELEERIMGINIALSSYEDEEITVILSALRSRKKSR